MNAWPGKDAEALARQMDIDCQTLLEIEGLPWYPPGSDLCDSSHPQACTNPYRAERQNLLRVMANHKITMLINSHNSNAYGPRTWNDAMWREYLSGIREDTASALADVWLGGPSEPWAWREGARHRTEIARAEWPGTFVLADLGGNGVTGRPFYEGIRYDYLEVHPCDVHGVQEGLRIGGSTLVVTDCTPVIASRLDAATRAALFSLASELGKPLIIYDHDGQ